MSPHQSNDDDIWEYDGLHAVYQGDCEEMLLEMQKIFYEDLAKEEFRKGICILNIANPCISFFSLSHLCNCQKINFANAYAVNAPVECLCALLAFFLSLINAILHHLPIS